MLEISKSTRRNERRLIPHLENRACHCGRAHLLNLGRSQNVTGATVTRTYSVLVTLLRYLYDAVPAAVRRSRGARTGHTGVTNATLAQALKAR
jgi:hypothetical protein